MSRLELSTVGSPPGPVNASNIAHFLFSNPYSKGGDVSKCAPTVELSNHSISSVSYEKPLLADPETGRAHDNCVPRVHHDPI